MTPFRKLTEDFYVAPQLVAEDFARAASEGFTVVVNNRPDGEAPDQLGDAASRAAAENAGLVYAHVPIRGAPTLEDAQATAAAAAGRKTLAFCRSGTRSTYAWALAQAQSGADLDGIAAAAAAAGYDLSPLMGAMAKARRAQF